MRFGLVFAAFVIARHFLPTEVADSSKNFMSEVFALAFIVAAIQDLIEIIKPFAGLEK